MSNPNAGHVGSRDPDVDYRIQEIADELVRVANKFPMRLSGDGRFLQLVAQILKRENRMANNLKCALALYDKLFESMTDNMGSIIEPPADVIDVPFEPQSISTGSADR